jgi:PA14 domain
VRWWWLWIGILALAAIGWCIGSIELAHATPYPFTFTAPCTDVPPSSPDTACGYTEGAPPLSGLYAARLYLWRFDRPGDTLHIEIPTPVPCVPYFFDLDLEPGCAGEVMITSVDDAGNESCIGSHVVFAVPAREFNPGLWGEYYDTMGFSDFRLTRGDPTINFNWGSGSPDTSMGVDTYSIRWSGHLRSSVTGVYTFCAEVNDGVRLWINGTLILNYWTSNGLQEPCASVNLQAGSENDIVMEFYEDTNTARAILRWTPPGGVKEIVPVEVLTY